MKREILFREAVIGTLIDESKTQEKVEDSYCRACKTAWPDKDCSTCDKDIVREEGDKKAIGRP